MQWLPPPIPEKQRDADEQIAIDLGDEYEQALNTASQDEIIDLAGNFLHTYILYITGSRLFPSGVGRGQLFYCNEDMNAYSLVARDVLRPGRVE